jgi:flagellar hook-associated protein 1 FlgK
MGTLTALLHVTTGALAANQTALTATAENIANQNTPGYTRRSVTWTEGDIVSVGASTSPGVQATVSALRDRVLQFTVQQATETSSASSTRLSALDNLQSLFNITSSGDDASGINAAVSDFFGAATTVAATPTDSTAQQSLYTAAQTLASTLNRAAGQITVQSTSLSQQVATSVAQVNSLTAQIAALNKQIGTSSVGDSRDTLLDQRDSLVTNLSQLVDVNTISSDNDGMNLALADGTPLVSGTSSMPLTTGVVSGAVQIYAAASTGGANVTNAIRGGSIGGALQARDEDLPAVSGQLDALAAAIATAVNTQNAAGITAAGTAGTDVFSGTTAATLTVIASDSTAFASTGTSPGSNALALGNLASAALVGGKTASDAFSSLLSNLGSTGSNAQTQSTADAAILSQTSTQLDSVSGVSLDQEAANLTQYQRSYEAAAKVLTIVDELLAEAINLGQQTTVT